jgi:hypothetical protein
MEEVKADVSEVKVDVAEVKAGQAEVKALLEKLVTPRVQNAAEI